MVRFLVCCLLLAAVPARAAPNDLLARLSTARPLICAHRGWLSPVRPENSLRTMRETEARGRFMLEMDLALDRDGDIVLMHDATIDRTTDATGPVASLDAAALQRIHLRARAAAATGETPPLLSDVLSWSRSDPSALLMLDLKHTPPASAMRLVERSGMTARVLLLTFDRATARAAFDADPAVLVSVLVTSPEDLAFYAALVPGRRFAAYIPLDRPASMFAEAHRQGAVVVSDLLDPHDAFSETRDPALLRDRRVDILVTNYPLETQAAAYGAEGTVVR